MSDLNDIDLHEIRARARANMTEEERRAEAAATRLHYLKLTAEDAAGRLLLETDGPGELDVVAMAFAAKLREGIRDRSKDGAVEFKRCPLCLTTLEIRGEGRPTMVFTPHTREFCELGTLDRIRTIEKMHRQEVVEREHVRRQGAGYYDALRGIADQLEKIGIR